MSKEYLEALEHVYYGSQGYGETDKYYKYLKDYLEYIDNANPSEALEGLKHIKKYYIPEPCSAKTYDCLETINQALLKQQEPKQYLKWEDLKFTYDEQKIKVKLNGENYTVVYFISPAYYGHNGYEYVGILKDDDIVVYSINGYLYTANLLKQFFNNLHLEVIENE